MHEWKKLSERVNILTPYDKTDRPVLGLIYGTKYSLMIDAGNSIKHIKLLKEKINSSGLKKPDFIVLTHWHWDHVFGLGQLEGLAVSNEITKELMKPLFSKNLEKEIMSSTYQIKEEFNSEFDIDIRYPDITFSERISFELGDLSVIVEKIRCDHTEDCNLIFVPEERILFVGDSLYAGADNGEFYYHEEIYMALWEKIMSYSPKIMVDSHRMPFSRERIESDYKKYRMVSEAWKKTLNVEKSVEFLKSDRNFKMDEEVPYLLALFGKGEKIKE